MVNPQRAKGTGIAWLSKATYNRFVDMFDWWLQNQRQLSEFIRGIGSGQYRQPYVDLFNDSARSFPFASILAIDRPALTEQQDQAHYKFKQGYFVRVGTKADKGKLALLTSPLNAGDPKRAASSRGIVVGDGVALLYVDQAIIDDLGFVWNCQASIFEGSLHDTKLEIDNDGPVTVLWPTLQQIRDSITAGKSLLDANNVMLAKVRLQDNGGTSVASTDCASLRQTYNIPAVDPLVTPALRFVPVHTSDGICEYVEIVECGMDVTPPCVGCTGESPSFLKLRMTGVSLVAPDPPSNGFEIGAGQEVVLTRSSRCGYLGTIPYQHRNGDPDSVTVNLTYDEPSTDWILQFSDINGTVDFTPLPGPHDCMAQHIYSFSAEDVNIPGYDFTGSSVTLEV